MTTKTKRVYDDPNHPRYGPVRRLWVILAGLGMLEAAEDAFPLVSQPWDRAMCINLGVTNDETEAARWVVSIILRYAYGMCRS